mmetsp:Transcript_37918/g.100268  ORF Transcript_37918/g.100268 Transcript_37918/m.100268 type:complete len:99 (+) Transcript_37918:259-555(+)
MWASSTTCPALSVPANNGERLPTDQALTTRMPTPQEFPAHAWAVEPPSADAAGAAADAADAHAEAKVPGSVCPCLDESKLCCSAAFVKTLPSGRRFPL